MILNNRNLKNFTFYLLLVFLVFLILEIFLQIYYKFSNKSFLFERVATPIFVKDEYCCYKNKSNLEYIHSNPEFITNIYTDEKGYRISRQQNKIDLKKKNILILGPSISFGQGVNYENSYSFKLQKHFENYNFFNGSVPGHYPEMSICWLINNVNHFKPDIIIQNLYDSYVLDLSSIDDLKKYCKSLCKKHNLEVTHSGFIKIKGNFYDYVKSTLKKSSLIFYTWYFYEQHLFKKGKNQITKDEVEIEFNGDKNLNEKILVSSFKKYDEILKKIYPEIEIFFVLTPPSFVVSDKYRHRYSINLKDAKHHRQRYKYFSNIMKKNFQTIDAYSSLKRADTMKQTYYNIDVHFTIFGNQVVFELLKEFFEKKI